MAELPNTSQPSAKQQQVLSLFGRLLPLVDSLADKVRLAMLLGFLAAIWIGFWCFQIKHLPLGWSVAAGGISVIPALILARFWWALEEMKNLPNLAGQMLGDAKADLQDSLANLRTGKAPKLGIFSAGKSIWSLGAMATEARDLFGSYFTIATLANPLMLILGVISLFIIFFLVLAGIILALFTFF